MRVLLSGLTLALGLAASGTRAQEQAPAAGDDRPKSLAELAPAAIPDADNAAAQIEALTRPLDNWTGDQNAFDQTPLGTAYFDAEMRGEPPTAEQAAAMHAIIDRYADLDAGLQRAAACSQFASRGDFTKSTNDFVDEVFTRTKRFRSAGRFLSWRISLLLLDGQRDEAVRRGIEKLRLARLQQSELTIVNFVVTNSVRQAAIRELSDAMSAGNVPFEAHVTLEKELALVDNAQALTNALRSELSLGAPAQEAGAWKMAKSLNGGVGVSDYLIAVIKASEGPWGEFRKETRKGGKWDAPTGFGPMADRMAPTVALMATRHGQHLAVVRSLRVYNALRVFAKLKKREATGLEELELPEEAMADPYADGPLVAKLTDEGWLVYSVMENGKDDGGDFRELLDFGVGPRGKRLAE